jgi:hypothetical protein
MCWHGTLSRKRNGEWRSTGRLSARSSWLVLLGVREVERRSASAGRLSHSSYKAYVLMGSSTEAAAHRLRFRRAEQVAPKAPPTPVEDCRRSCAGGIRPGYLSVLVTSWASAGC